MVFSKNKASESDSWKEKYLDLLDSQEQAEQQQKITQDLLCKTVSRLALAATGYNRSLDPHLEHIRQQLKSSLTADQLKQELQNFSNALMVHDGNQQSGVLNAALLFDFLSEQLPQHHAGLERIHDDYDAGRLINPQQLFAALSPLMPQHAQTKSLVPDNPLMDNSINRELLRLLEAAELPTTLFDDAGRLKTRLLDGDQLPAIIDDAVGLLESIKQHADGERQALADFLATLTVKLTELGAKAAGVNLASEDADKRRDLLDRDLAEQMADLQHKSSAATQLEPLKQLINQRLASISQQINQHNSQEQAERKRLQSEFHSLTQKLSVMELEAGKLQQRLELAQRRASHDHLTGLPNRMALSERLSAELARSRRHNEPLSIAVWDIDHFKAINDTYGHKSGDKALVIIAKLLAQNCRQSDFLARYGGEEFVMLLPETRAEDALSVANKLRALIENTSFNANGNPVRITVSCGLTQLTVSDDPESLFERADAALYTSKQNGRNQCMLG